MWAGKQAHVPIRLSVQAVTSAILPEGWERRVVRLSNRNTGGANRALHRRARPRTDEMRGGGREQDLEFNRELVWHGIVSKRKPSGALDANRRRAQAPHSRPHQVGFRRRQPTQRPEAIPFI